MSFLKEQAEMTRPIEEPPLLSATIVNHLSAEDQIAFFNTHVEAC